MVQLLCGPIIGHVTSTTAFILLEIDESIDFLSCILQEVSTTAKESEGKVHAVQENVQKRRPRVFQFGDLQEETTYDILVTAVTQSPVGRLRTLPLDVNKINIAVVSCNKYRFQPKICNMWERMWGRIQNAEDDVHILLHVGDNVYIDGETFDNSSNRKLREDALFDPKQTDQSSPYIHARKLLRHLPPDEWDSQKGAVLELYRNEYRETFNQKYTKLVLSHVSNLMILDDHDVRDDFGLMPEDSEPDSVEFFLGTLAVRVYHEYGRQLWDPAAVVTPDDAFINEFFCLTFGPVGVIMLESRTVWSINKGRRQQDDVSFYGEPQMKSLFGCLHGHPEVNVWCVSYALPLIFLHQRITKILTSNVDRADDYTGHINYKHRHELEIILEEFKNWKSSAPNRELFILSGDVHVAGFTDIYHRTPGVKGQQLLCRQITSSPINNEVPGDGLFLALKAGLHFADNSETFTFKHYNWVASCNYAVLCFEKLTGPVEYMVKLVHEKGIIVRTSAEAEWFDDTSVSCVCNVL